MTTQLTQQNLKIYASHRLHDGDDGGGRMTSHELSGTDNELFNPISDVDRVMGAFHCRLVYPAVLRDDKEPLYGAHVMISRPPKLKNVSFLLFAAESYGEEKRDALPRMTAYSVPTIESAMTLLGNPLKGTRMVQAYQNTEEPVPQIGQRYVLSNNTETDYFRILNVESAERTFYEPNGAVFTKNVVKMETTAPLPHDHTGLSYPVKRYAQPKSTLMETQVADSMRYYGVRPVVKAIAAGDQVVSVDTVYERLVPTSTIETVSTDQEPVGTHAFIPLGGGEELMLSLTLRNLTQQTIRLPYLVMPGSLRIANIGGGTTMRDDGQGNLVGAYSGKIDYATGEFVVNDYWSQGGNNIFGERAVRVNQTDYTAQIPITESNQGTEFSPYLLPKPAMGSLTVSFLSLQEWYVIQDRGDGYLFDQAGNAAGRLTRDGSLVLSLPALPDVGSNIVISWVPDNWYQSFDGQQAGASVVNPQTASLNLALFATPYANIKPNTVELTLRTTSGDKTLTDDGSGAVSGDGYTGRVDYATGQIYLDNAKGVSVVAARLQHYTAPVQMTTIQLEEDATQIYGIMGEVPKGTVEIAAVVKRVDTAGHEVRVTLDFFKDGLNWKDETHIIGDTPTVNCLVFHDDGNHGLVLNGRRINGASVDYATGMFFIPKSEIAEDCVVPSYTEHIISSGATPMIAANQLQVIHTQIKSGGKAYVRQLAHTNTEEVYEQISTGIYDFDIIQDVPRPKRAVLNSWRFTINGKNTIERNGNLIQNFDPLTGLGDMVGELDPISCTVRIFNTSMNLTEIKVLSGVYIQGTYDIQQYYGRTVACPVKPLSFTVRAENSSGTLIGQADEQGNIQGSLKGFIDYETGFWRVSVNSQDRFLPGSLKYNSVSSQEVPLDADILGIDTVRLPPNGKVPIFRRGDMVVISNRQEQNLGSAITAGQTIQLDRTHLDRVCVVDFNGVHINAELYTVDYEQGTISFADPLDLSDYSLPLTAHHAFEEENRVVGVDVVSGSLKLGFAIRRDYSVGDTFISSALVGGDLQVRATAAFSQQSWNKVWADTRQTDPILAQLNDTDYPIELTDDGAINQRWLLRFVSSTSFEVYGETLGLLLKSDTISDLSPTNPATGKPYFTIRAAAFGGGWATGNCIRFNTQGTMLPVWVIRAVTPSAEKQTEKDGFTICLRGNTVEDN